VSLYSVIFNVFVFGGFRVLCLVVTNSFYFMPCSQIAEFSSEI
jgi:hypothetical protein